VENRKEKDRAVAIWKVLDVDITNAETVSITKVDFSGGILDPLNGKTLRFFLDWSDDRVCFS
jgi:hypothetical protein